MVVSYEILYNYLFFCNVLVLGLQSREDRSKGFFEVSMPDSEKDINEEEIDEEVNINFFRIFLKLDELSNE